MVFGWILLIKKKATEVQLLLRRKKLFAAAQFEDELHYEGVVWVKLMMAQSIVLGILGKNDFRTSKRWLLFWKEVWPLSSSQNPFWYKLCTPTLHKVATLENQFCTSNNWMEWKIQVFPVLYVYHPKNRLTLTNVVQGPKNNS